MIRNVLLRLAVAATLLDTSAVLAAVGTAEPLPVIRNRQLIVDGKPFIALGGELHNSSSSSPEYMLPIWDKLHAMNVRAVVSSVDWNDFEPKEGQYDYRVIDAQLAEARKRDMRIVLIWFGAFKNAASMYAPTWVRGDTRRFPRVAVQGSMTEVFTYKGAMLKPVLSVFGPELVKADRAAFAALMKHLAQVDKDHRVIMVQVNNETGMLRDSRDRSALAEEAWKTPVPTELLKYLAAHRESLKPELAALWARQGRRSSGTWSQVFGTDWEAEEVFMAWHFARYMESLAAAGKRELALPMYANGWLGPQEGQPTAGLYPSGGPGKRVLDVWRAAAPSLDLLAPDIYAPNAKDVQADYAHPDQPLYVPEARFRTGDTFWALGQHATIGYAPFGIEDGKVDSQLAQAYGELFHMDDVITKAQAERRIAGVLLDDGKPATINLGGFSILIRETTSLISQMMLDVGLQAPPPTPTLPSETEGPGVRGSPGDGRAFGLIIAEGDDTFLMVGKGFTADFSVGSTLAEIDRVEEGHFGPQGWKAGRAINGDERLRIVPLDRIGAVRIRILRPASR